MKRLIKKIDWVLFAILLFASFAPLLYKGYRLYMVSNLDDSTLELAINWGYVYMIFESVNIFVIVPSYWFIRRNAETMEETNRNMLIIILFTIVAFFVSLLMISIIGIPIAMSSVPEDGSAGFDLIYGYILTYGASLSIHLFINVMIVYIIVHNRKALAFTLTLLLLITTMTVDSFMLNDSINPSAGLITISESMFISSVLMLLFTSIAIYTIGPKSWNNSFKLLNANNLFEGWRVYSKNGMWLGLEALTWNLFNALGVFCWFLFTESSDVETAFWIMDGLFWGFLLLPATAVTMFTAEGISNEETIEGRKDVIKMSVLLSCIALLSWVVFVPLLVMIAIPSLLDESMEVIDMTKKMCWIFLLFIAVQVPTKVIYTYFSTTNRSVYLTVGTLLGSSLTWGISFITIVILNFTGVLDSGISNELASIIIPIIYGLGILFIFVFYMVFYVLTINDTDDTPGLTQRWKMRHELIKTTVLSDS